MVAERRVGDSITHALVSVHACAHASVCGVGVYAGRACGWGTQVSDMHRQGLNEDQLLEISVSATEVIKIYW